MAMHRRADDRRRRPRTTSSGERSASTRERDRRPDGSTWRTARAERMLRLIGLGVRGARRRRRRASRCARRRSRGKLALAVVAPDASQNSLDKIVPLLQCYGALGSSKCRRAAELGAAVGREQTAVVGIVDPAARAGIRELVAIEARPVSPLRRDV